MNQNVVKKASVDEFYSPLCLSGYLTPVQRRKLREKGKLQDFSVVSRIVPTNTSNVPNSARKKSTKKIHHRKTKLADSKAPNYSQYKFSASLLQCTAAELLNKQCGDSKNNKFFKNRSPKHLLKAKFIMPRTYSPRSLSMSKHPENLNKKEEKIKTDTNEAPELVSDVILTENIDPEACSIDVTSVDILSRNNYFLNKSNLVNEKCSSQLLIQSGVVKEHFGDFCFSWPSDDVLKEREIKANVEIRQHFNTSLSSNSSCCTDDSIETSEKLYPIFTNFKTKQEIKNSPKRKMCTFMDTSKNGEQLIIDAGQKEIGALECKSCHMIYTKGQEEDERLHSQYHMPYIESLKFPGWANERVIGKYDDGRIILVKPEDKKIHMRKVEDVLFIANRDLGFHTRGLPNGSNVQILLFVSMKRRVCGCLIAESIASACPVVLDDKENLKKRNRKDITWQIGSWYASSQSVQAVCGINRIWVSKDNRRQKIASRMVDCLRSNFIHGHIVTLDELAFTDPSAAGREFAAAYTRTDNFLVYK